MGIGDDTELIRHIIPAWAQGGEVTSVAFRPHSKTGLMSAYNGDMISISDSLEHFKGMGKKSVGATTLRVKEYKAHELVVDADGKGYEEHVTGISMLSTNQNGSKCRNF